MALVTDNPPDSQWRARYGRRHGFVRLNCDPSLPNGRRGRVTIYRRGVMTDADGPQTFILSWCAAGQRRKERVVGDKFEAVRRADEINESLQAGTARAAPRRLGIRDLIAQYLHHVHQRADAAEISPNTPKRYGNALEHLAAFVEHDPDGAKSRCWQPSRDFALRFKAHLRTTMVSPNGHRNTSRRPLTGKGADFILGCAKAMVRWAAQEGWLRSHNAHAFCQSGHTRAVEGTMSRAPVTTEAVIQLIQAADVYQLGLFSFHIFHGVRVAEPCWLMIESFDPHAGWVEYRCIEELAYRTKGAVDKRLPLPDPMIEILEHLVGDRAGGPLLVKRRFVEGDVRWIGTPSDLASIVQDVRRQAPNGWLHRASAAQACLKKVGVLDGDDVRREFGRLLQSADFSCTVTPKALRHHFATALELANVPYYTRKYLLGHRLRSHTSGRGDATAIYTHLEPDFLRAMYQRVLDGPLASVLDAFTARWRHLSQSGASRPQSTVPRDCNNGASVLTA